MTQALERLAVLQKPLGEDVLRAARDEVRATAVAAGWDTVAPLDAIDASLAAVMREGTLTANLRQAWESLGTRLVNADLREPFEGVKERVAIGATTDVLLAASVFAYRDESYLIAVDRRLWLSTFMAVSLGSVLASRLPARPEIPISLEDAVAAIRLSIARSAIDGRAGTGPVLVLTPAELYLTSMIATEVDAFILAHEVAHVMLGHFREGRRGFARLAGEAALTSDADRAAEHAADEVAPRMLLDDVIEARASPEVGRLRLIAIRITFALIDAYEHACFAVQPMSHPPASVRMGVVNDRVLRHILAGELDPALGPYGQIASAIERPPDEDLVFAAARIERGLERILHPHVRGEPWADLAQMATQLLPRRERALQAVRPWFSDDEGHSRMAVMLSEMIASGRVRKLLAAAGDGEPLTRLRLLDAVADTLQDWHLPFPAWAFSALVADRLAHLALE